jgi:hypothetical protein
MYFPISTPCGIGPAMLPLSLVSGANGQEDTRALSVTLGVL